MRDERNRIALAMAGAGDGNSAAVIVAHLIHKDIHLSTAGSSNVALPGTVAVQGKLVADDEWETLAAPLDVITESGIYRIETSLYALRLVVSSYSSGTLKASYAGFNPQS